MYRGQDEKGRARLDLLLYGPPIEEEWLSDPRAMEGQRRAMAMAGGDPDALVGEAPALFGEAP